MIYIFSGIAFIVLLPIILLLPLGVRPLTKFVILLLAFGLGIVGIVIEPYIGMPKLSLILILLTFVFSILVDRRRKQESYPDLDMSSPRIKREIVIQDQEATSRKLQPLHSESKVQAIATTVAKEKEETREEEAEDSALDFVHIRDIEEETSTEQEVAVGIENEESLIDNNWIDEILVRENVNAESEIPDNNHGIENRENEFLHNIDEILEESSSISPVEEESESIDTIINPIFSDLDELDLVVEEKEDNENLNNVDSITHSEMETLEVLHFQNK